MTKTLVADEVVAEARRVTGLEKFDSDSYREGLDILISDFNKQQVADEFCDKARTAMVGSLAMRLRVTDYLDKHPELLQRSIERPVFVCGMTRTGTTLLSNLLATDPARLSALTWLIDDPIPPTPKSKFYNDPRVIARLEQERAFLAANPDMGKYYRNSAIYPNECMFWMIHDFKGLLWEGYGKVPNYRDWLFQTDMSSTYAYHKRFLQLLQAEATGTWNLKMPSHSLWIETLLKFYPDARLVWTHRDPLAATGSFCSLMELSQRVSTGRIDTEWLGQNYPWQAIQHANRFMDAREKIGHDRVIDVHYADMLRQPIETMRKLYQALGDDFTPAAENAMRTWLADNPQDKFGKHEYKLAKYGLTEAKVTSMFERYLSHYEVEKEGN